ncbi:MAG TPA: carboxymuconolactone decarboxylase family protein [Longimicrobiales bacterium]|nr:carboxymuconolactone decarboxylase family protein [Longimicrobiales bacterium]
MRRYLMGKLIEGFERRLGVELPYLNEIATHAPGAFVPILMFMPATAYGPTLPSTVIHMVRLGATQALDCGECLEIAVNVARQEGVGPEDIATALSGRADDLPAEHAEAFEFGRRLGVGQDAEEVRRAIRARYGERGLIEASMAAATSHLFPVLKKGMGFARACELSRLGLPLPDEPAA